MAGQFKRQELECIVKRMEWQILKNFRVFALIVIWVAGAMLASWGCDSEPKPANPEEASYFQEVHRYREQRDRFFQTSPNTPLLKGDQENFDGLHYFPIKPAMRFALTLHKYGTPDTLYIMTTGGKDRPALRYGYFEFEAQQRQNRLQVYKFIDHEDPNDPYLFLPFLDQTSGEHSYGGGRYLDLRETVSDEYTVDFNYAYNPSCAYGRKDYICPVPPSENTLQIEIPAGEKAWH